jgi:hypothetical protein
MTKKIIFPMIVSFILLGACTAPVTPTPSTTGVTGGSSKSTVMITVDPAMEQAPGLTTETQAASQENTWTVENDGSGGNSSMLNIYLVALEDNGKSGKLIGCGDSLVGAQVKYGLTKDETTAKDTLAKLFAVKQQYFGESGLYNALYQSDLKVESLTADANRKATLNLSGSMMLGGVCDNPRFEEQIRATVLQFKDLYADVDIFVNGKALKDLLSEKG